MISSDNRVSMAEVVALFWDAMAKNTAVEKGGDEAEIRKVALEQALRAVRITISYLNGFPEVQSEGLVRVLAPLHSSLHDVASGAHPPFVFAQGPPARPGDRPTGLTHDYVRACLAFALNLLLAPFGCISKKTALAWLAGEAARQRVVAEDGRAITVHQLRQWRRDIKAGSAPKTSREHFRELGELYRDTLRRIAGLPPPARAANAQERARISPLSPPWRACARPPDPRHNSQIAPC
jgi:hypothetical protein